MGLIKTFGVIGGVGVLYLLYSQYSKSSALSDKFKFFIGQPDFAGHEGTIGFGFLNLTIKNSSVTNQSNLTLTLNNIYATVQYQDAITRQWKDLTVQRQVIASITIPAYSTATLPPIAISLPDQNVLNLKDLILGKISGQLKVVTRLQLGGIEQTIETMIDAAAMFAPIKNYVGGFLSGLGSVNTLISMS